jgi:hypothetical protein
MEATLQNARLAKVELAIVDQVRALHVLLHHPLHLLARHAIPVVRMRACQKRPIYGYVYGKRDLSMAVYTAKETYRPYTCVKRDLSMAMHTAKEACAYGKRGLCIRKRPVYTAKEGYVYCGHAYPM